jgi:Fe-S-cluster formation regulator IscX/YfhJ
MSIGILTIATNKYIDYWMRMVESFEINTQDTKSQTFFVFTDVFEVAIEFSSMHPNLDIKVIKIDEMGFPEATLLRYEIYNTFKDQLKNEILMHLDADMLIRDSDFLQLESIAATSTAEMILVSHPGYWRPKKNLAIQMYARNPRILLRDLYMQIKLGGIGSWETDVTSQSFVPRKYRKNYACGGIWMGKNDSFKKLCSELSVLTQQDLFNNKIPLWHDESFLNMWASKHEIDLLDSSYCFDPRYVNLKSLKNIVEAVNKSVE